MVCPNFLILANIPKYITPRQFFQVALQYKFKKYVCTIQITHYAYFPKFHLITYTLIRDWYLYTRIFPLSKYCEIRRCCELLKYTFRSMSVIETFIARGNTDINYFEDPHASTRNRLIEAPFLQPFDFLLSNGKGLIPCQLAPYMISRKILITWSDCSVNWCF